MSKIIKMGPNRPGMLPEHSHTLLGHLCTTKLLKIAICKSRPHMAHLVNLSEAKCSYVDLLFVTFSPQLSFCVNVVTLASLVHEKTLFHVELSLN